MKIKVGVFFGGNSVEHEISVISALQAINAFDTDKYDVVPVYVTKDNNYSSLCRLVWGMSCHPQLPPVQLLHGSGG